MQAFENFITAAKSGGGESMNGDMAELGMLQSQTGYIFPGFLSSASQPTQPIQTRAALAFLLSEKGNFFREFLLDEVLQLLTFYRSHVLSGLLYVGHLKCLTIIF
jgi:aarF domain-containing kinase